MWSRPCVAVALLLAGCAREAAPAPVPPDILLVSLDTVRQDRGPGPWGPGVMPRYAAFAAGATRFSQAWAPSSNTLVSHGSLFTGLYPWQHRFHPELASAGPPPDLLPRLAARGYAVAAFTAHPQWLGSAWGFHAGAATFRSEAVPGEEVLRWVDAWLKTRPPAPRALFVHLYDAHSDTHQLPYEAPEAPPDAAGFTGCRDGLCASRLLRAADEGRISLTAEEVAAIRAGYDAGVRHTDALLGQLLDATGPLMGDGLVAVFADHGELLGEGGWLHHGAGPPVLDIPLAVRWPGQTEGREVSAPVSLVDLYGAVRGAAGDPDPARPGLRPEGPREGPVVAMNAARLGDRIAIEREGGAVEGFQRQPDGAWAPAEVDGDLAALATNPVEALNARDVARLSDGAPAAPPVTPR